MNTSDFLRLIAGGILALVCSYIGILIKRGYSENTKLYKDLVDFCDAFKRELTFQKSALIDFCNKFCDGRKGDIVDLIQEYIKDLQSVGQFVRDAEKWTVAHLKKEEKQEIIDFLSGLGKSPTVEQLSLVDKSCQLFQSRQKIALDNEKKKGNMFFKLLVLLGIALMVILV